jgi:hypothetical protein
LKMHIRPILHIRVIHVLRQRMLIKPSLDTCPFVSCNIGASPSYLKM